MSRIRPGEIVEGRYRLDRLLGEGGYGAVYAATHLEMGTPLALKLLHSHHTDSEEATARFRREARNTARLRHPHCVTVFDFGRAMVGASPHESEVFFLAMELLEGEPLTDLLRRGPIDPQRAMVLLDQILLALEAAHGLGLIHRDLKPDNIFLVKTGGLDHVKVLDFGIAKTLESEDSGSITASGTVIGTPAFMSPEQCRGTTIDARSDLYSLGCVAWAMLAGQPPFKRDSTLGYLLAHVQDPPGDIATVAFLHEIPPHLRRFIATCLEKNPDARYPTASAARKALVATGQHPLALTTARGMAVQDPPGPRRRKWPFIALGGAVVGVGLAVTLMLTSGDEHAVPLPTATVAASTQPPEQTAPTPEPAVAQAPAVLEDTALEDTRSEDTPTLEADIHAPLDTLQPEPEVEAPTLPSQPRLTQAELTTHAERLCTTARRLPSRTSRTVEAAARAALTANPLPNVELEVTQAKTITLALCTGTTPDRECASCTVPPSAASPRPTSTETKPQPTQPVSETTRPDPPQASRPKAAPQPTRPKTTKPPEFERLEE